MVVPDESPFIGAVVEESTVPAAHLLCANGATRMRNFLKSLFGIGSCESLDHELLARVLEKLKREPSDQLRTMFEPSSGKDKWSPEAIYAARQLDRKSVV